MTALGLSGAIVGGANYFFHGFRTSLGVSGKAALVVSTAAACMHAPDAGSAIFSGSLLRLAWLTYTSSAACVMHAGFACLCHVLAVFRAGAS